MEETKIIVNCWYCSKIKRHNPDYAGCDALFDMGSETPRCERHWRFVCDLCRRSVHFQGVCFCPKEKVPFCKKCSLSAVQVKYFFWGWSYYWSHRCPFCALWHPTLDYQEYEGGIEVPASHLSKEKYLEHHLIDEFVPVLENVTDEKVAELWSENAETWSKFCGPEGDMVRKHISDPVLFRFLGDVSEKQVLDAGCGEGYLCRILAGSGAKVWGIENSKELCEKALAEEKKDPKGVRYFHASISNMSEISDKSMDAIVCNNVFMYCPDLTGALHEFARVLKHSGHVVAVFTHPCFWGPGTQWHRTPPDAVHAEEWSARIVQDYFDRNPHQFVHPDYGKPLVFFPRTIGDYFSAFALAGFQVSDVAEPELSGEKKDLLPPSVVARHSSFPASILFRLVFKR